MGIVGRHSDHQKLGRAGALVCSMASSKYSLATIVLKL
jgi:hypothetical protein